MNRRATIACVLAGGLVLGAHADNPTIDSDYEASSISSPSSLSFSGITINGDDSILVLVGAHDDNGGSTDISVSSVALKDGDKVHNDVSFVRVWYVDGTSGTERVEAWKLNHFDGSPAIEDYEHVAITFTNAPDAAYASLTTWSGHMQVDFIRRAAIDVDDNTAAPSVTAFTPDDDGLIISAHMWWGTTGSNPACTGDETEIMNVVTVGPGIGSEHQGFLVQYAAASDAANKAMDATLTAGTSAAGDTAQIAIAIRSDDDIIHTPSHTPNTLLGPSGQIDAPKWAEGLKPSAGGGRDDITDWGTVLILEKVVWMPGSVCAGNSSGTNLRLWAVDQAGGFGDLEMDDFGPDVSDREEKLFHYLQGFEEQLDANLGTDNAFEVVGDDPEDWESFTGLVIWDHEHFPMDYGGCMGGTNWGSLQGGYDTQLTETEYDAAARYFWENVHQWFVEIHAPAIEALVFYHHPQQPTKAEGLDDPRWTGKDWQDDIAWLFKLQGAFDGHCYPIAVLRNWQDASDLDDMSYWVETVFLNFESIEFTYGTYCYVTHWPGVAGGSWYPYADWFEVLIETGEDMRTLGWETFDQVILGAIPTGSSGFEAAITGVSTANDEIQLSGNQLQKFDDRDGVEITGWSGMNGTYDIVGIRTSGGLSVTHIEIDFDITDGNPPVSAMAEAPPKGLAEFLQWWEGGATDDPEGVLIQLLESWF